MIRAKFDMEPDICKGDLFLTVNRFVVMGGYEYARLERISDGRKFKVPVEKLESLFDDPEGDVFENAARSYMEMLMDISRSWQ